MQSEQMPKQVCVLDVRIATILCIGSARVFGVGVAGIILPHGTGRRRREEAVNYARGRC